MTDWPIFNIHLEVCAYRHTDPSLSSPLLQPLYYAININIHTDNHYSTGLKKISIELMPQFLTQKRIPLFHKNISS